MRTAVRRRGRSCSSVARALVLAAAGLACAPRGAARPPTGVPPPAAASSPPAGAAPAPARLPDDPIEAVRLLVGVAAGRRPGDLERYVDADFARRLPSGLPLEGTLAPLPTGCELALTREEGYGAIAVPPPMVDEPDDEVRAKEAIIARLSAGVEVHGACAPGAAIFAVALGRVNDGAWRVLAWRRLDEPDRP